MGNKRGLNECNKNKHPPGRPGGSDTAFMLTRAFFGCARPRNSDRMVRILNRMAIYVNSRQGTKEACMTTRSRTYIGIAAAVCIAVRAAPLEAKQCYAPDARAQERAFSRA